MKDISKEVLEKIKSEQVRPLPRWHFVFRRSFLFGLFVLSILIGGLASSVVIFQLTHAEWDLYRHLRHSLFEFTVLVIPYFWLGFMLCFALFTSLFFRRTGKGYRYRSSALVLLSMAVSLALGVVLYWGGLSWRFEGIFQAHVPFYQRIQMCRMRICVCPEHGLLAGEIVGISGQGEFRLRDFKGKMWHVQARQAVWRGGMKPGKGAIVKIIGKMNGKDRFMAKEIRPWRMGPMGCQGFGSMRGCAGGTPPCPGGRGRSSP